MILRDSIGTGFVSLSKADKRFVNSPIFLKGLTLLMALRDSFETGDISKMGKRSLTSPISVKRDKLPISCKNARVSLAVRISSINREMITLGSLVASNKASVFLSLYL